MKRTRVASIATIAALCWPFGASHAAATEEQLAALDSEDTTCMGAPRAGTESGVAEYTGKWFKTWPGQSEPHGYQPGPYADEEPVLTIDDEDDNSEMPTIAERNARKGGGPRRAPALKAAFPQGTKRERAKEECSSSPPGWLAP